MMFNLRSQNNDCIPCSYMGAETIGITRYSFGIYAGRMCDDCWKSSGYRDATDDSAEFSEMDAGERLEEDY